MFVVVCCLLIVVRFFVDCWLLIGVCCVLFWCLCLYVLCHTSFDGGWCWLSAACCYLPLFGVCCVLFVACFFFRCGSLFVVCCVLFVDG